MVIAITTEPLPLAVNPDGVVQVGGTRVTLDIVVTAFNQVSKPIAPLFLKIF